jgi:ergothioneine biosynthesis protein EgtB
MDDASPPKWHLAHTSWFFETFLLNPYLPHYVPFHPGFEFLFNSYYNGVGEPFPRARRGYLSRPTVSEVFEYRQHVDTAMERLLASPPGGDDGAEVIRRTVLGLNHEQQHQELMVTDLKYNFGHNPLAPAYLDDADGPAGAPGALTFAAHPGGLVTIGAGADDGFHFDNEEPAHSVYLEPFLLASRVVTCEEYLAFMADGGYADAALWLSDGWAWVNGEGIEAPLYWQQRDGEWWEYRLNGLVRVAGDVPVTHVSAYEADAFARWAGARLPTEAEWESVATSLDVGGNLLESGRFHPAAPPKRADGPVPSQMYGDVWEWTSSAYGPYPGYRSAQGALGEYNGKFMANQLVLRGGSCVTPGDHIRASYRNFFYPPDRWQFTGIRLARDDG